MRRMADRRTFLKALAAAAGSTGVIGRLNPPVELAAQGPPGKRREVAIAGRRVKVIDVHAHCVIPEAAEIVAGTPLATSAPQSRANALGPERLRQMDQQGLDVQALSINGFWWYAADRPLAEKIVRAHNTALAKWTAAHPERFAAMNSVALQFPELAAEQIDEGVKSFGLRGIAIGGHVNGEDLSLPKYDVFWAKAAELDHRLAVVRRVARALIPKNQLEVLTEVLAQGFAGEAEQAEAKAHVALERVRAGTSPAAARSAGA